jgi:hypothetical protein
MADGKDRQRVLRQFDDDLNAPLGADDLEDRLNREFARTID